MSAHNFMNDYGFIEALKRINKTISNKIVIIGSGNAAFYSALLLIKGPTI